MKKLITYILFALVSFSSFGQYSFDKEKNKYWIYRERLKNFMVRSHGNFCTGCDILANDRGNDDMLEWNDAPWMIGYWMGTLAMEYRLLRNAGLSSNSPEVMQTKKDLYGAIQSINRLDCEAKVNLADAQCPPDFVFEKSYDLFSLKKRRDIVFKNKHLPYISSGKEMKSNGLALGEFSLGILQIAEEHELYLYDHDERIEFLENENKELKVMILSQNKRMDEMQKKMDILLNKN